MLSITAVDEVTLIDPARFEANIICQLNLDSGSSLVRDDCVPLSVKDHMGKCLDSFSTSTASVHPPYSTFPWLNNMLEQPSSLTVSSSLVAVEDRGCPPVNLDVGVYGSDPGVLSREVVRDALAINVGSRSCASSLRVGLIEYGHSESVRPAMSVARSNVEDVDYPLAVDFSFLQS